MPAAIIGYVLHAFRVAELHGITSAFTFAETVHLLGYYALGIVVLLCIDWHMGIEKYTTVFRVHLQGC